MKKKIIGAIIPALLVIIYLMAILVYFIYIGLTGKDIPLPAFIIIIIGIIIPIIGISIALIIRIKEIKTKEEEKAKKY